MLSPIDSSDRVDDDDAENRVAVLGAVELIAGAAEVLAVDLRLRRPLRVLRRRVLPAHLLRARRQQDELGEVAIEHGQLGQLLGFEARRHVGAVGLEQRRAAAHRHLLGHRSDFELEVDRRLRVDADRDAWNDGGLEAGELRLHLVRAGQQPILGVDARLVGHHRIDDVALEAP